MKRSGDRTRCNAFTLIEVLVVVAIITLLIAILLPSLTRAREQSKTVICTSQLQQLMKAALLYATDSKSRSVGVARSDGERQGDFEKGFLKQPGGRNDYLSWFGTWADQIKMSERDPATSTNMTHTHAWQNAPKGGRLWKYYRSEALLKCPSAHNYNGKISYSTPENVALAVADLRPESDPAFVRGLPPLIDRIKDPASAIELLDEDEDNSIANNSLDDGFGTPDLFADRHLGKATVAFFDGHAEAHFFFFRADRVWLLPIRKSVFGRIVPPNRSGHGCCKLRRSIAGRRLFPGNFAGAAVCRNSNWTRTGRIGRALTQTSIRPAADSKFSARGGYLMNGVSAASQRIRTSVLFIYWTTMYLATHWPDVDDIVSKKLWLFPDIDKVFHFFMYAGWAVLWWWVLSARRDRIDRPVMLWLSAGGAAYALFDELTQIPVGRRAELGDFLFDFAGVCTVVLVLKIWQARRSAITSPARRT